MEASLVAVKLLNSDAKIFAFYILILINSHRHVEISENIVDQMKFKDSSEALKFPGQAELMSFFDITAAKIRPTSARSADMASCCHLEAESGALPRNQ